MSGCFSCAEGSSSCLSVETHSMGCFLQQKPDENDFLREELNRFWKIKTIGKSEKNVIYQFENEIQFNGTRYIIKLPFKTDHDLLPDNIEVAKIQLQNLKQRLLKENIFEKFDKMSRRPILRENKGTTKIRAVFDVSCASNGPSLNDCFYVGLQAWTKYLRKTLVCM